MKHGPKLKRAAYHEAGHAIVATMLLRTVTKVTIFPFCKPNTYGQCHFSKRDRHAKWGCDECEDRTLRERIIMTSLAGPLAQQKYQGHGKWLGHEQDYARARAVVSTLALSNEEAEAYLEWLSRRALALLSFESAWKAVEVLASELLEKGKVSGRRVRAIYRKIHKGAPAAA